jgi:hypothetical protein
MGSGGRQLRQRSWALRVLAVGVLASGLGLWLSPALAAAEGPDTIFGSAKPTTVDSGDGHSVVLGVKFRSEVAGVVSGVRFYKAAANTGTHVGSLWSASGTLLASATFTGESASGWQQVSFSTPVAIAANTTYLATYLAPKGHYSDNPSAFASAGVSAPPLSALANSASADGVYAYSASNVFPTASYRATNYWVDVDFEPAPLTAPGQVAGVSASAGVGSAYVSWNAPVSGGAPATYTITPYVGSQAQAPTVIGGTPPMTSATVGGLTNGTTYTFTVTAANAAGSGPPSAPSNPVTPSEAPIAYPDLQVLVPPAYTYIVQNGATRTLEFEHITSDLGAGPLEIRPSYNSATGISQGFQALYTMPSPGVWRFDHTVPIVGPMYWEPPSDYRFPLDKFALYASTSTGGLGTVVATSPKALFCMTSDTYIGGVPNAPSKNEYPAVACTEPNGRLGLTVGWGDQYDATDGGEGIDISSLPNGVYWLRAEADPYHYLQESNYSNNITDTKLLIEGTTVKVLEQTHPDSTPPTVTLASPTAEAKVSGTATLTATATGPHPIASVQFLLDGQPLGAPVTAPPYTLQWTVPSTVSGAHYLSAQATDSEGFVGTALDVPVTVEPGTGGGPDKEPPVVSIASPAAGAVVSGAVPVSATVTDKLDAVASVQFYLNGQPLGEPVKSAPYALTWYTTLATNGPNTLTAQATDVSGNVGTSAPVAVTVENPGSPGPCFVMDANVSVAGNGAVTTPSFTTATEGEQLLAFVGSDGPNGGGWQSATVSGAGLEWKLVTRANSRSGDAEIWWATAPKPLVGATVTSTPAVGGYDQSLTVIAEQMSNGIGASAAAGAASGAPSVSLQTTGAESLVFAVGNDYDNPLARTVATNQVLLHQELDTKTGDTYWSQYTGAITGPAGETVTMNDTAPTTDQWNMAAVELLSDGVGK